MSIEKEPLPNGVVLPTEDETNTKKKGVAYFLRANFVAGLLVLAPALLTFYILRFLVVTIDGLIISVLPSHYRPEQIFEQNVYGLGLIGGFLLLTAIGLFARNFIGRRLVSWVDSFIGAIPGVRSIYSAVKQIVNTLAQSNSTSFREVVMVEYPRQGLWAIAFVTGTTKGEVQTLTNDEVVNVFLPTTPNPTSGFLLFVPRKAIIPLHMSVEQGLKLVISAGIVTPTLAEGKAAIKHQKRVMAAYHDNHHPGRRKNDKGPITSTPSTLADVSAENKTAESKKESKKSNK